MKLFLATTSKFKSNILNKVKLNHFVVDNNFEEISSIENVYEYVKFLALSKAQSTNITKKDCIILGLDTVVYINDQIVEKPKSLEEVKCNLRNSSNNTVSVITGIALINRITDEVITDYQETKITFNYIDDKDIDYYINNEPDTMYASGFIIETVASNFIKNIDGSFYNILGVPVEKIYEYLLKWNIHLYDLEKENK